jgi:hypothetical protein
MTMSSSDYSGATTIVLAIDVTDELTIDIVDNGCGIAADNQRRSGPANLYRRARTRRRPALHHFTAELRHPGTPDRRPRRVLKRQS